MEKLSLTGFRSPAETYAAGDIDWNTQIIPKKHAMHPFKVEGNSLVQMGIQPGDIVVVDTSIQPVRGDIVLSVIEGHFVLGQYQYIKEELHIVSDSQKHRMKDYEAIEIRGVVTSLVRFYDRID